MLAPSPRDRRESQDTSAAGLGKLYQRTGRREQAKEHLVIATTMYPEIDMQFWLARAEAETNRSA